MESSTYNVYSVKLSNLINTANTRGTEGISDSAEIYLKPFVLDGQSIQKNILVKLDKNSQDYKYFQDMSEEQLASLSFLIYNLNAQDTRSSSSRLRSCLATAVGVASIKELSVDGIITATTLSRALIAIGKRYLGYIGVALMVADFYDCIQG